MSEKGGSVCGLGGERIRCKLPTLMGILLAWRRIRSAPGAVHPRVALGFSYLARGVNREVLMRVKRRSWRVRVCYSRSAASCSIMSRGQETFDDLRRKGYGHPAAMFRRKSSSLSVSCRLHCFKRPSVEAGYLGYPFMVL